MRIIDLVEVMIESLAPGYGYNPKDIKIKLIRIRPGEKFYEYLINQGEAGLVEERQNMFVLRPKMIVPHDVDQSGHRGLIGVGEYSAKHTSLLSKEEIRQVLNQVLNLG